MALFDFVRKLFPKGQMMPTSSPVSTTGRITIPSKGATSITSPTEAMTMAAYYACVNKISTAVASMPRSWYLRDSETIRKYTEYDQQRYIRQETSLGVIPFKAFRTLATNYLMGGNGYMIIMRDANFRPTEYQNRKYFEMMPFRDEDGYIWYYEYATAKVYNYYDVIHVADLSDDSLAGISKVRQFAQTLGRSKAAQEFVNKYFSNGLMLGAVVEYPESVELDDDIRRALEAELNKMYGSVDKAGQIGLIGDGGKLKQLKTDIPLGDSEFIEGERLTREDIAMIFSVPLSMLDSKQSSYNTLEQTNTQFYEQAVLPVLVQIEQEFNLKAVRPSERDTVYMKHEFDSILRADAKTQAEVMQLNIMSGVMTINEARRLKEMAPVEGGDQILVQANNLAPLTALNSINQNPNPEQ